MKKFLCAIIISILSNINTAYAVGWTAQAVPTHAEVIRGQGFMIFGSFGNPASPGPACTNSNTLWIAITHPQYDQLYSLTMSALMSGKEIKAFAHQCTSIGWHGGTFNEVTGAGAIYIYN